MRDGRASESVIPDPPPPMPDWLRDVLAAVVVISVAFAADPAHVYLRPSQLAVGLSIIAAGLLPLRRWWPIAITLVMVVFHAVCAVVMREQSPGLLLAMTIAVFGVFNRRGMRVGIGVAAVALLITEPATWLITGTLFDYRMLHPVFFIAFAGAAGDYVYMHRQYVTMVRERALRGSRIGNRKWRGGSRKSGCG